MKRPPQFTQRELGEIWDALEMAADGAHDGWRDSKAGRERKRALAYKKRIAKLMRKVEQCTSKH